MGKQLRTRNPAVVFFQWRGRKISRFRLLLCLMVLSTAMWIAFANLVVPRIIASAYRGESLPFLNNLFKWQHIHSVDHYLKKWDGIASEILVSLLGFWLLALIAGRASLVSRQIRLKCSIIASRVSRVPHSRASASILALVLICVPLTIGAIWAFPIWDDAWFWLLLKDNGTGIIATTWVDRPVMGTLWSLFATSEHAFWRASLVAQALLWPTLGIMSALLWTCLFPNLRRYAMVVGCVTVAPIISKVQMVTANIAFAHLLSVVLSYGAFLLLVRFVMADDRFGRVALALSLPILGLGILVTEYALPVVVVMVIFFWSYVQRASDPETRVRARRAIFLSTLTAGAAYAIFFIIADFTPRGGEVSPFYVFTLGKAHLAHFPVNLVEGIWRSVAGGFVASIGEVSLTSKLGMMAAAYGALVAGLLFYGSRNPQHVAKTQSSNTISKRDVLPLAVAFVVGLLPTVAMGRIPWNPGDGMSSRFELPLLPITASLIVLVSLSLVRQRFWAVPILLLGFVAGNTTFTEVWSAIRERQEMSALGAALQAHVSPNGGYTVAAVVLPERSLGPRRPYELTVRLTATWPQELRRKFWAFRFGGVPPIFSSIYKYRADLEAEAIFGTRGDCKPPREFKWRVRLVGPDGPLNQLIWVKPQTDGFISVEPYCMKDQNEHQILHQQGSTEIDQP
jgi:hypothetical protein